MRVSLSSGGPWKARNTGQRPLLLQSKPAPSSLFIDNFQRKLMLLELLQTLVPVNMCFPHEEKAIYYLICQNMSGGKESNLSFRDVCSWVSHRRGSQVTLTLVPGVISLQRPACVLGSHAWVLLINSFLASAGAVLSRRESEGQAQVRSGNILLCSFHSEYIHESDLLASSSFIKNVSVNPLSETAVTSSLDRPRCMWDPRLGHVHN